MCRVGPDGGPDEVADRGIGGTGIGGGGINQASTETADEWTGFLDGAVRSGQRAAAEVAARLTSAAMS